MINCSCHKMEGPQIGVVKSVICSFILSPLFKVSCELQYDPLISSDMYTHNAVQCSECQMSCVDHSIYGHTYAPVI
jgi:hypothetical protein